MSIDFSDEGSPEDPHAFIQWKGTDVCMDFHCECGAHSHFDGSFAYTVKCQHCDSILEMPLYLKPRKADQRTYEYWRENPHMLDPDEDYCDQDGRALPVPDGKLGRAQEDSI